MELLGVILSGVLYITVCAWIVLLLYRSLRKEKKEDIEKNFKNLVIDALSSIIILLLLNMLSIASDQLQKDVDKYLHKDIPTTTK